MRGRGNLPLASPHTSTGGPVVTIPGHWGMELGRLLALILTPTDSDWFEKCRTLEAVSRLTSNIVNKMPLLKLLKLCHSTSLPRRELCAPSKAVM